MRIFQTILISFISLTVYCQNAPFLIVFAKDTILVSRCDTIFTYRNDNGEYFYDNQYVKVIQKDELSTIKYGLKINGFQSDINRKLPIATLITHGRQTTVANETKKIILEGNIINGKQVGIWHDRLDDYDNITFYDSSGTELPIFKYNIDTSGKLISVSEIDSLTSDYILTEKISLIVNPASYFKSKSAKFFSEDTIRFCILNQHMDTLGYESWKTQGLNYIRFVWFRDKYPISLVLKQNDIGLIYNLIVTDAEFDFRLGNIVEHNSMTVSEIKDFADFENELDKMLFWQQISDDSCFGDYLFIEAKINNKYNTERINCLEYRMPENKKIMKLFSKLAKDACLEKYYKIEY